MNTENKKKHNSGYFILKRQYKKLELELERTENARKEALKCFVKACNNSTELEFQVEWLLKYNPWIRWLFNRKVKQGHFKKKLEEGD